MNSKISIPQWRPELPEIKRLWRIDPDHESTGGVGFEGGWNDVVTSWTQFESGKDLSVVDVGSRGAFVVVVHEIAFRQASQLVVGLWSKKLWN